MKTDNLLIKTYPNGQKAVYLRNFEKDHPLELSLMHNSVELEEDQFILNDSFLYGELIEKYLELEYFSLTNRYILVQNQLCPVCCVNL